MMKPISKKKFEKPIILIKTLDSGDLLVVDSNTTVAIMDRFSFELKGGFKGKISHTEFSCRVVDFSRDKNYFVSISSDSKETKLFNIKTKKLIAKINRHHGAIACVAIDLMGRYMFSCGEDGKTFATDIKSTKLAFTLPVHVDAITDIVFSDNSIWLATASYDKKIQLFSLSTMSPSHKLIGHSSAVVKMQFLSNNRLFSIDKDSNGIVWDIKKGKVLVRLKGIHDSVLHVTKSSDDEFLFLGTALGYILVYELEKYKLLSAKYIKLDSSITALGFNEAQYSLMIATKKSELFFYNIFYGEKNLEEFVQKKEYASIHKYLEVNPLLIYTKVMKKVEIIWDLTVKKAKLALERNDKVAAIKLFKSFKNIPEKNRIMQKIILEYAEFNKFVIYVKQAKLPLAYSMANKYP
ncbi:MAG: hypothetical protein J7L21_02255, partial [Sulfurimonas sp.]|nr:hypothetical protein [Sulfurimonas sp.]